MGLDVNPSGSSHAIEGITSPDGRVLGKMGHSERTSAGVYANIPDYTFQPLIEGGVGYFTDSPHVLGADKHKGLLPSSGGRPSVCSGKTSRAPTRENRGTATHSTHARESAGATHVRQALVGMPASRIVGSANR